MGAGIANGILGAKESARRDALLRRQERANRMWYDRTYNEAGRETAVGQRMRELMAEANRARQASARGKGAVMGGTTALQAAEASESSKATADLLGRLDANQEARRDRIDAAYRQRDAQLVNAEMSASAQKQANLANAVSTASAVASQIGGAVDSAKSGGTTASKVKSVSSDNDPFGSGELGESVWNNSGNGILGNVEYDPMSGTYVSKRRYPGSINNLRFSY